MPIQLPFGYEINRRADGTFLSKRHGARRPGPKRRYLEAAQNSDLTHSWSGVTITADQMLIHGLQTVRARSRDQAVNNDYGRRFMSMVKGHVVGPEGILFQSKVLFADQSFDIKAVKAIEAAWEEWKRPENSSMSGTDSWLEQQKLFISAVAEDGEAIFQKAYGKRAGAFQFALHQVDPSSLDIRYNINLKNGCYIRMGIEFDVWRRPLAYHFLVTNSEPGYFAKNGKRYTRIPADQIIHGFIKERVNQSRGIPWMAASLLRMKMLGAFEEAALVNARVGASKVGVITTPSGNDFKGDDEDKATGDQIMEAEPGTFLELAEGQTVGGWDPAYPNGEFDVFTKRILRGMSAGLLVDYPGLSGDLEGVNFSSIRAGVLETRETWKVIQVWMIERFNRPIFEAWLDRALWGGKILINGKPLSVDRYERYKRAAFQPRRWAWVDPLKDLKASQLAIKEGLASRSEIIRERGGDPESVWEEIERENALTKTKGLVFGDQAKEAEAKTETPEGKQNAKNA